MVHRCNLLFSVSPQACVIAAVTLLLIPLPWMIAWFTAATVHELSHCLMVLLCGKRIESIMIGGQGAEISTDLLTGGQVALCAVAGSAGGFLLLMLASQFPRLAVCALLQSAYNLLPVFPLDGGRALLAVSRLLFPYNVADTICHFVESVCMLIIFLLGFICTTIWKLGVLPLACSVIFLTHMKKIKKLANKRFTGYNSATKIDEVRL